VLQPPSLVGHIAAFLQVAAGAERLVAFPGQDHAPDRAGIGDELLEAGHQLLA